MSWLIGLGVVVVVIVLAFELPIWFRRRPRIADAAFSLQLLRDAGYQGGWVTFTHQTTGLFVQCHKYIEDDGIYGIELVQPMFGELTSYAEGIKAVLVDEDIEAVERENSKGDMFLYGDFKHDTHAALRVFTRIITEVYQLPEDAPFKPMSKGISLNVGEVITRVKDQPATWRQRKHPRYR